MSETDQLKKKVRELEDELAWALWDNLAQGDIRGQEEHDGPYYGHMFRSDLEAAHDRLIELGRAEHVPGSNEYLIREVKLQRGGTSYPNA